MRWAVVLFCSVAMASAAPLGRWDFDQEAGLEAWRRKTNTTVTWQTVTPHEGPGALRFSIDPTEFTFGWIHAPLVDGPLGQTDGIHGWWRADPGTLGSLQLNLCLANDNQPLSYFRADLGSFGDSGGQWVEFYVPLSEFVLSSGPARRLSAAELSSRDLLQFIASIPGPAPAAVELDSVELLDATAGQALRPRLARAARERLLKPAAEQTGAPHPRLLLTPARLPSLRAKANTGDERAAAYAAFFQQAEQMLRALDPTNPLAGLEAYVAEAQTTGRDWSGGFEGRLIQAVSPLEILAAAYQLSGDQRFGQPAAQALANAAERLTADEPYLRRGFYYTRTFYVRALAFGYDWLHDLLTPAQRRTVAGTLLGFVTTIHADSQKDGWGRRPLHRVWNWDPGLMGACGLGLLALEGETRLGERALLFDCRRHIRDYLTLGIDADGCGHEGPSYLGYGIGGAVEFAEILRQQGRGDLFVETNYARIAPWLIAETLPDGRRWNNLSDCGHGQSPWPVYLYACARLAELAKDDPLQPDERFASPTSRTPADYLAQFADSPGPRQLSYGALGGLFGWAWRTGPGALDPGGYPARLALAAVLLYEPPPASLEPARILAPALHFRGRGLVVCRTGYGPDDFHLAVEAGPHAAGHDQSDKGQFTFRAYGADLAIDSGYGNDGDHQKSGSSYAHNVVLIDGQGQPLNHGHNQSSGQITGFGHHALLDWVRVDAREAWNQFLDGDWRPQLRPPVAKAERSLLFVRPAGPVPGYLVVFDDVARDQTERDYTWQWHIPSSARFAVSPQRWTASPVRSAYQVLTTPADQASGSATFRLTVAQAGRYCLFGLVRAGGAELGKSDSFLAQLDDSPALTWDLGTGATFGWDAVRNRPETAPHVFELSAGEHRFTLGAREPQAELARLLLLPADQPPPPAPDEVPAGALVLDASQAALGAPGLLRQPTNLQAGPAVHLDVYPVHPGGGQVATGWYLTSREGSHPRLQYTVRAANPGFVMVLVPRRADTPVPEVQSLGRLGAEVRWAGVTDRILFADGEAGGLTLSGSAGFVRTTGDQLSGWALLDGRRLAWQGRTLTESAAPEVRFSP